MHIVFICFREKWRHALIVIILESKRHPVCAALHLSLCDHHRPVNHKEVTNVASLPQIFNTRSMVEHLPDLWYRCHFQNLEQLWMVRIRVQLGDWMWTKTCNRCGSEVVPAISFKSRKLFCKSMFCICKTYVYPPISRTEGIYTQK